MSAREESEIKGLKHIFFDVILIDSTKVIETSNIFKFLTDFRAEFGRNTNYA